MARRTMSLAVLLIGLASCGGEEPTTPPSSGGRPVPEAGSSTAATPVPDWAKVSDVQKAEAARHGVPVAFENPIGMRFVLVPAGTFHMGSPMTEEGRFGNETQHEVVLTRPFYLGLTEVTNGEYRRWRKDHDSGAWEGRTLNEDRQPVVMVSWTEAKGYAEWLTGQEGRRGYRLPTEAEWEHACRAGTRTRYVWGDGAEEGWKHANANDPKTKEAFGFDWEGWPIDDGYRVTAPVGTYSASPWGLYEMHGNVWEWCGDWYGGYPGGRATDPSGPRDGTSRVLRGGSWDAGPRIVRSALRIWSVPDVRYGYYGFRLVSPLPASR